MSIQDYETKIKVPISQHDLTRLFPDPIERHSTTIFIDNTVKITLDRPSADAQEVLALVRRHFPRLNFIENTYQIIDKNYIRIESRYYWIGENSEGAVIVIRSHVEDYHQTCVEEVKAALLEKGIIIKSGECYVTIKELC